jgi:glycolate oxidase iron-sulfur subunit
MARLGKPFVGIAPKMLRPLLGLAPRRIPAASPIHWIETFPAEGDRRMRVALLPGCAQQVLAPEINLATIRLLTRHGCEVVVAPGSLCCGALTHHLGEEGPALAFARANIDAWEKATEAGGLDAVVANASGCGTMLKDYGFLLRTDARYADKAARIAGLARDVSEVVAALGLRSPAGTAPALRVAYHSACSLQHWQKVDREPRALLAAAGFSVVDIPEGHLCCGSAGTYNILQPELAAALRDRKLANIALTRPDVVAAGNIGCMTQLGGNDMPLPVVHTVELLDWATGGPAPPGLAGRAGLAPGGAGLPDQYNPPVP